MKTTQEILRKIEDLKGAMEVLDPGGTAFIEAKNRKEALEWVLDERDFEDEGGRVPVDLEKNEPVKNPAQDYPEIKDLDRRNY
jgi:hypothetical protein